MGTQGEIDLDPNSWHKLASRRWPACAAHPFASVAAGRAIIKAALDLAVLHRGQAPTADADARRYTQALGGHVRRASEQIGSARGRPVVEAPPMPNRERNASAQTVIHRDTGSNTRGT